MVVHDASPSGTAWLGVSSERSHRRRARSDFDLERFEWGHVLRRPLWHRVRAAPCYEHGGNELECGHAGCGHDLLLAGRGQEQRWHNEFPNMVVHDAGIRSAGAGSDLSSERSQRRLAHADLGLERFEWGHVLRRLLWRVRNATVLHLPAPGGEYDRNRLRSGNAGPERHLPLADRGQEQRWLNEFGHMVVHDASRSAGACFGLSCERSHRCSADDDLDLERFERGHVLRRLLRRGQAVPGDEHDRNEL